MRNQEAIIKRKKRSAVLAGLLVLVMMLTGTWAWQRFNQQAFNPYVRSHSEGDLGRNFGGRLHNDFKWYDNGTHNKDIYAENFGEEEEIFVRIQLREFLTIDGEIVGNDPKISITDPSTWPIYNSAADSVITRREGTDAALIGEEGIEWDFGGYKIFMPTFNQATHEAWVPDPSISIPDPFNHLTAYRMTNATGNAVDAIADGFYIGEVENVSQMIDRGVQTGKGTAAGDGSHDYWREEKENGNGTRTYPVLRVHENGHLYLTPPQEHTAQSTLLPEYGGIMTMEQWLDHEEPRPRGNFWVLDTEHEGGWFYWADPLPAEEATSLLLNEVTINEQSADLEYIITPRVDFVTRDYIYRLPQLSDDAKDLWNIDRDETPPGIIIPTDPGGTFEDPETGIVWRVLEPANIVGNGGLGNALIITNQTVVSSNHINIITSTNYWFNNPANVSADLRAIGLNTQVVPDRGPSTDPLTGQNTFMLPGSQGTPQVFSLSRLEAEHYFVNNADRATTGTNTSWWLRSTTLGGSNGQDVSASGSIINAVNTLTRGVRPALWVSQE